MWSPDSAGVALAILRDQGGISQPEFCDGTTVATRKAISWTKAEQG